MLLDSIQFLLLFVYQMQCLPWYLYKSSLKLSFNKFEDVLRKQIYLDNLNYIKRHNAQKNITFRLGLNKFAHLTNEEFIKTYIGSSRIVNYRVKKLQNNFHNEEYVENTAIDVVKERDWRKEGVITKVKDQGQCGSCWAFSSTGALESAFAIKNKTLVEFSEQDLVDCSQEYGNYGCSGGWMDYAYDYVKVHGISTEKEYPYHAENEKCNHKIKRRHKIKGYKRILAGDEQTLSKVISTLQPVAVAIDAGKQSFRFYKSGVYYEPSCSSKQLNHGVLAVGVAKNYYIVKNSWGTDWGHHGFIKMVRNRNNNCGISTHALYLNV